MKTAEILESLKVDLDMSFDSTTAQGARIEQSLSDYIELSKEAITKEGIEFEVDDQGNYSIEDGMLIKMYASMLYRNRATVLEAMPRQLRYMLNNRLFSQKAREE